MCLDCSVFILSIITGFPLDCFKCVIIIFGDLEECTFEFSVGGKVNFADLDVFFYQDIHHRKPDLSVLFLYFALFITVLDHHFSIRFHCEIDVGCNRITIWCAHFFKGVFSDRQCHFICFDFTFFICYGFPLLYYFFSFSFFLRDLERCPCKSLVILVVYLADLDVFFYQGIFHGDFFSIHCPGSCACHCSIKIYCKCDRIGCIIACRWCHLA